MLETESTAKENMDAVNRVFTCLEAFDAAERPMSIGELQHEVGCPLSSLAVTLSTLVKLGYLHHDRSRRTYAPTVLLANLGGWVASRFAPRRDVVQAAEVLVARTGESVTIGIRNDLRVQYIAFIAGADMDGSVRIGTTRLLCRSGVGWALLTFLNVKAINSIVRRTNAALSSEDRVDLKRLMEIVDGCRAEGHVLAENVQRAGYAMVAMPVKANSVQLAIGVSGPTERIRANRTSIVEEMQRVLAAIA